MKAKNIIYLIIIALLLLNASMLGSFLIKQKRFEQQLAQQPGAVHPPRVGFRHGHNIPQQGHWTKQLQLSTEQQEAFNEVRASFFSEASQIKTEIYKLRKQYVSEMSGNTMDTVELIALSEKIGQQHIALKKATFRHYIQMRKLCNTEQRLMLDSLIREKEMPHMGRGNRHKHNHKQFNY